MEHLAKERDAPDSRPGSLMGGIETGMQLTGYMTRLDRSRGVRRIA
jgi:hypothetical protein